MSVMGGLERARSLTEAIDGHTRAIVEAKDERLAAMREARAEGVGYAEIARAVGLSLGRVNQILGSQGGAGGRPVYPAKADPEVSAPVAKAPVKGPKPEGHRHHYVNEAWNHTRGAYLLRQRCDCGDTRVIPSPNIPKELTGGPDATIVAA